MRALLLKVVLKVEVCFAFPGAAPPPQPPPYTYLRPILIQQCAREQMLSRASLSSLAHTAARTMGTCCYQSQPLSQGRESGGNNAHSEESGLGGLLLGGTCQGGGARTASGEPRKKRIGAALCKTITQSR